MSQLVLLGDEAVAMGAIDAGLSIAYGYPGTPSTEIMEYLIEFSEKHGKPYAKWCSNEKTAYEAAVGVSLAGKRTIVTMKHVGLNVAADAFMNSVEMDIQGGLVLAVADDPGMHSSQNEQDSRIYADYAKTICLEPTNQQEAYEMTKEAFEISERFHMPVMLKLVTRLSHARSVVITGDTRTENPAKKPEDMEHWITLPNLSRRWYNEILEAQEEFLEYSESSQWNTLTLNNSFKEFGVITTGLAKNYYEENLEDLSEKPSHLHISVYPIPVEKIKALYHHVDRVVVLEEGQPYVERLLKGIIPTDKAVDGKMNKKVPPAGELNPDNVRAAIGLGQKYKERNVNVALPPRPPQLCKGCPHHDSYLAINEALKGYKDSLVTSDIGCYTLGYFPPYNSVESVLCMGASITMARGAAEAGMFPVIATLGDSTFMHSGITGLVDCVNVNANVVIVIMDNYTTGMTGGQDTIVDSTGLLDVIKGTGVKKEHIRLMNPLPKYADENAKIIKEEIEYNGVSVIVPQRECVQTYKRRIQTQKGGK